MSAFGGKADIACATTTAQSLTQRQALALAGEWYIWYVARHEENPGTVEHWRVMWDVLSPSEFPKFDGRKIARPTKARQARGSCSRPG